MDASKATKLLVEYLETDESFAKLTPAQFRKLLAKGADINARNENGWTALLRSLDEDGQHMLKVILNAGAAVAGDGYTPLVRAASFGSIEMVQLLLEAGADVHARNKYGMTALMQTTFCDDAGVAQVLLDAGADTDAVDNRGWTALIYAEKYNSKRVAALLESATDRHRQQEPAAGDAALCSLPPVTSTRQATRELEIFAENEKSFAKLTATKLEALLGAGADANVRNEDGGTPLAMAARYGSEDIVQALLVANAQVNIAAEDGWTPLMSAVCFGTEGMVNALIEKNADVEAREVHGSSALILAARNGTEGMVKALIAAGADVNAINNDGYTPLDMVLARSSERVSEEQREKTCCAIAKLLLENGAHRFGTIGGLTVAERATQAGMHQLTGLIHSTPMPTELWRERVIPTQRADSFPSTSPHNWR